MAFLHPGSDPDPPQSPRQGHPPPANPAGRRQRRVGVPIRAATSTPLPAASRTARKPRRRRSLRGAKLRSGGILRCASLSSTMEEGASTGALPRTPPRNNDRKKMIIVERRGEAAVKTHPAPSPHGLAPARLRAPRRPLAEPPPPAAQLTSRRGRARAPPPWFSPGG